MSTKKKINVWFHLSKVFVQDIVNNWDLEGKEAEYKTRVGIWKEPKQNKRGKNYVSV